MKLNLLFAMWRVPVLQMDGIKHILNSSAKCYNMARQSDVFMFFMLSLMVMFTDPQLHKYMNNILLYYPLAEPSINW